ncbi:MAG: TldD/PmbA family protein [Xanthomonadaceae bacterium]|nr:TldD/PmbA family protein [Xanthomonadaceae bacterium]
MKRAQASKEFQKFGQLLRKFLPRLKLKPDFYVSVYAEKKFSTSFSIDLKKTNVTDNIVSGAVFRVWDGYSLYEQATDDLSEEGIKKSVDKMAKRLREIKIPEGTSFRPYQGATWAERAKVQLEQEIVTQIPAHTPPDAWVHFGVRYEIDPTDESREETVARLKQELSRIQKCAREVGLSEAELQYAMVRNLFAVEESIFIDEQVMMSQSLYRCALTLVTMSGGERSYIQEGGLGGLEAVRIPDKKVLEMLSDLKSITKAERLHPGVYKVLFGPYLTGVLAHEAFGHSQEGDTCARGRSKAWEISRSKQKVGNHHATILNNPAIYENGTTKVAAWGSYFFDEEGWLAQEQILLREGKLENPMTNLSSALRLGIPRTANGKRESWANGVYTRQTNTYFTAGRHTLDELLLIMKDGYIAEVTAGGMEDPKGMGIQVGVAFLKEVKGGKLTGRVFKGPAGGDIQLTGYTPDILNKIVAKSKIEYWTKDADRAKHPFNDTGGCGKYHKEFVRAGCGGTYMLLDQVTLG